MMMMMMMMGRPAAAAVLAVVVVWSAVRGVSSRCDYWYTEQPSVFTGCNPYLEGITLRCQVTIAPLTAQITPEISWYYNNGGLDLLISQTFQPIGPRSTDYVNIVSELRVSSVQPGFYYCRLSVAGEMMLLPTQQQTMVPPLNDYPSSITPCGDKALSDPLQYCAQIGRQDSNTPPPSSLITNTQEIHSEKDLAEVFRSPQDITEDNIIIGPPNQLTCDPYRDNRLLLTCSVIAISSDIERINWFYAPTNSNRLYQITEVEVSVGGGIILSQIEVRNIQVGAYYCQPVSSSGGELEMGHMTLLGPPEDYTNGPPCDNTALSSCTTVSGLSCSLSFRIVDLRSVLTAVPPPAAPTDTSPSLGSSSVPLEESRSPVPSPSQLALVPGGRSLEVIAAVSAGGFVLVLLAMSVVVVCVLWLKIRHRRRRRRERDSIGKGTNNRGLNISSHITDVPAPKTTPLSHLASPAQDPRTASLDSTQYHYYSRPQRPVGEDRDTAEPYYYYSVLGPDSHSASSSYAYPNTSYFMQGETEDQPLSPVYVDADTAISYLEEGTSSYEESDGYYSLEQSYTYVAPSFVYSSPDTSQDQQQQEEEEEEEEEEEVREKETRSRTESSRPAGDEQSTEESTQGRAKQSVPPVVVRNGSEYHILKPRRKRGDNVKYTLPSVSKRVVRERRSLPAARTQAVRVASEEQARQAYQGLNIGTVDYLSLYARGGTKSSAP